ncbi:unnamed protein product [Ilex paraguariensis]|uniref:Amidase domain-containing protein n=1 Tax=Ilex paraguariensis TaxID=185542 RepID=A0ABC8SP11_9AQUA
MLSSAQTPRFLLLHSRFPHKLLHFQTPKSLHTFQTQAQILSPSPPTSQILTIRESLLSRSTTAVELASNYLHHLRRTEPHLNSFLHISDTVLKEAEEIDRKIQNNEEVGPLAGVLVGVKDNICTVDMPSTAGSRALENYRPPFDATAVRKLRECGAIVVGKTNLDEFGMGSTTEGSAYQFAIIILFLGCSSSLYLVSTALFDGPPGILALALLEFSKWDLWWGGEGAIEYKGLHSFTNSVAAITHIYGSAPAPSGGFCIFDS